MNNSCCGFRLATFGLIVGWLNFVGSLISTVVLVFVLSHLNDLVRYIVSHIKDKNYNEDQVKFALLLLICFCLIPVLINLVASLLLIMGTVKQRHLLVLPWLINNCISILFGLFYFGSLLFIAIDEQMSYPTVPALFFGITGLAIQCIIWSGIYSLFKEIREDRDDHLLAHNSTAGSAIYPNYSSLER